MKLQSKLRVVIPDQSGALDVVKAEIEGATGFAAQPEFQEVEHSELIVEVRLPESETVHLQEIADAVGQFSTELDVLSTWNQVPMIVDPYPEACDIVYRADDEDIPIVARRSITDDLATAQWLEGLIDNTDHPCWMLAVPVLRSGGRKLVGVRIRRGYTRRFSPHEAAAIHSGLVA